MLPVYSVLLIWDCRLHSYAAPGYHKKNWRKGNSYHPGYNGVWILGYSNRFTQITFMPFYGKWSYMVFTSVEIPSEVSQSTKIYWTTTCTGLRLNCEGRDSRPRASGPCPYTIWHAHACLLISYTCPSAIKMNSSYGANKNRNTRGQKI